MNERRQTQDSLAIVGAMTAGIFLVAMVGLMLVGGYGFSPALFLAGGVAGAAGLVLLIGFHQKPVPPRKAAAVHAPAEKLTPSGEA